MNETKLNPTLGLFAATMLAVSIVVGAGMLVLPGLVLRAVGPGAWWSWIGDTLIVVPILWIFVRLGALHPTAGGVAGFVTLRWPRAATGTSFVLLGTFSLGIPAIALTGARYLLAGLPGAEGTIQAAATAFAMLVAAAAIVHRGARIAGRWQNLIVVTLLALLALIALASMPHWSNLSAAPPVAKADLVWQGMALAFFSYTGWEMFASIAEDMKNPARNFPRAVVISFLMIVGLYLGAALAVESMVPVDHPQLATAPFLPVLERIAGSRLAGLALSLLALVIIFANLVGAVWAASRIIFDLARGSDLGRRFGLDALDPANSSPKRAVVAAVLLFGTVLALHAGGKLGMADMLWLAGQNFFVLYTACAVVFLTVTRRPLERFVASGALALLIAFGSVFDAGLLYPLALFLAPYALRVVFRCRARERQGSPG